MRLYLLRDDLAALERALLEAYPRLVCYGEGPDFRRPVVFLRSLTACRKGDFTVAIPEPGWEPLLRHVRGDHGGPRVANPPHLKFWLSTHTTPLRDDDPSFPGQSFERLWESRVAASSLKSDDVKRRFMNDLMKILRGLTSPDLARYDLKKRAFLKPPQPVPGERAGHHALAWCRARENRAFCPVMTNGGPSRAVPSAAGSAAVPTSRRRAAAKQAGRLTVHRYGLKALGVFFTPEDSDAFGRALEAAFPATLFRSWDYRWEVGIKVHRSLGELHDGTYTIHLSEAPMEGEAYRIDWLVEPPPLALCYDANHGLRADRAADTEEKSVLEGGTVSVPYRHGDAAGRAFAERIMRILKGVSSPALERVDPKSGPKSGAVGDPGKRVTGFRAGRHALAWCRADPRRLMIANGMHPRLLFRAKG